MTITRATSALVILAVFVPFFNAGLQNIKTQVLSAHIVKYSFENVISLSIIDIFFISFFDN